MRIESEQADAAHARTAPTTVLMPVAPKDPIPPKMEKTAPMENHVNAGLLSIEAFVNIKCPPTMIASVALCKMYIY